MDSEKSVKKKRARPVPIKKKISTSRYHFTAAKES